MRNLMLLLILSAGLAAQAMAQGSDADTQVYWSADSVTPNLNARTVTASGNVVINQGNMRLRADRVEISLGQGSDVNTFAADGRVVMDSPSGTITSDSGVYDVAARMITFTGKVILTRDNNIVRGNRLTYNVTSGHAKFTALGGRVQGLFSSTQGAIR